MLKTAWTVAKYGAVGTCGMLVVGAFAAPAGATVGATILAGTQTTAGGISSAATWGASGLESLTAMAA